MGTIPSVSSHIGPVGSFRPSEEKLTVIPTTFDDRELFGNRFLWLFREVEGRGHHRIAVVPSGHDKELFFRKSAETNVLRLLPADV
jgi:hypothetical protein